MTQTKKNRISVLSFLRWCLTPLIDLNCDRRILKYFTILYLVTLVCMLTGTAIQISRHLDNFIDIPEPLYVATAWILATITFLLFDYHKQRIQAILELLQGIAVRSTLLFRFSSKRIEFKLIFSGSRRGNSIHEILQDRWRVVAKICESSQRLMRSHYCALIHDADGICDFWNRPRKLFRGTAISAIQNQVSSRLARCWRMIFSGNFRSSLPYLDAMKSPQYEICYIICVIAGLQIMFILVVEILFFAGICYYVTACFTDLRLILCHLGHK